MLVLSIICVLLLAALLLLLFRLIGAEKENASLKEKLSNAEQSAQKLEEIHKENLQLSESRFKNLAAEIMDDNSRKLREQNELRLAEILTPLKDNIESFRKSVNEAYSNEARERFSLEQRIKEMIEVNRSIGAEARQLTNALKGDTKIQGDWGEMILEKILEKSGLQKDTHYKVQLTKDNDGKTLKDSDGNNLRPDVVVYYPDKRCIVIDSKVSLKAYTELVNAENNVQAEIAGRKHVESVRENMRKLASKNYNEYVGEQKSDFVLMFIPNEGAYLSAMNLEPTLWQEAYDKRVVIISPTHLISALRLVEQLWKQDDIKRNVLNIADEGGKMYDKFVGFVDDMNKIGNQIKQTQKSYDDAMNKLSTGTGNLITRAEKMRTLGAKATKRLPSNLTSED